MPPMPVLPMLPLLLSISPLRIIDWGAIMNEHSSPPFSSSFTRVTVPPPLPPWLLPLFPTQAPPSPPLKPLLAPPLLPYSLSLPFTPSPARLSFPPPFSLPPLMLPPSPKFKLGFKEMLGNPGLNKIPNF